MTEDSCERIYAVDSQRLLLECFSVTQHDTSMNISLSPDRDQLIIKENSGCCGVIFGCLFLAGPLTMIIGLLFFDSERGGRYEGQELFGLLFSLPFLVIGLTALGYRRGFIVNKADHTFSSWWGAFYRHGRNLNINLSPAVMEIRIDKEVRVSNSSRAIGAVELFIPSAYGDLLANYIKVSEPLNEQQARELGEALAKFIGFHWSMRR